MVVALNSLAFAIFYILIFCIPINFEVCKMLKRTGINVKKSKVPDIEYILVNGFRAKISTCLHSREFHVTPSLFKRWPRNASFVIDL